MPPASAVAAAAPRKRGHHLNAAARAAATTPRAPVARSRVTNGTDILPGIDGRSPIARRYRDICAALATDQGGAAALSEARLQLCRRFAALSVMAEDMEANMANGAAIDIGEYAQLASTLVRVVARLGINRVAKDVTPSVADYVAHLNAEEDA